MREPAASAFAATAALASSARERRHPTEVKPWPFLAAVDGSCLEICHLLGHAGQVLEPRILRATLLHWRRHLRLAALLPHAAHATGTLLHHGQRHLLFLRVLLGLLTLFK